MSSDPTIREFEGRIASEEKTDQRSLDHAIRGLKDAEKAHGRALKSAEKANHNVDKAVKKEHKAATAALKAEQEHEAAVANQQNAEKTFILETQHAERLEQDLQQRHASLDGYQHRKDVNDQQRETKLADIHTDAASRAGSRVNSVDRDKSESLNRGAATGDKVAEGPVGPNVSGAGTATA